MRSGPSNSGLRTLKILAITDEVTKDALAPEVGSIN